MQVRLCKAGFWRVVLVDDLFPASHDHTFVFSFARRRQLWVPLIEKAYAKLHGSYEVRLLLKCTISPSLLQSLCSGTCAEALTALTGAPCVTVHLRGSDDGDLLDADLLWARLQSSHDAGYLIGAMYPLHL